MKTTIGLLIVITAFITAAHAQRPGEAEQGLCLRHVLGAAFGHTHQARLQLGNGEGNVTLEVQGAEGGQRSGVTSLGGEPSRKNRARHRGGSVRAVECAATGSGRPDGGQRVRRRFDRVRGFWGGAWWIGGGKGQSAAVPGSLRSGFAGV